MSDVSQIIGRAIVHYEDLQSEEVIDPDGTRRADAAMKALGEAGYDVVPTTKAPDHKAAIAVELYTALQKLGAKSDLLSIVGSYGDTRDDGWVLAQLHRWNNG